MYKKNVAFKTVQLSVVFYYIKAWNLSKVLLYCISNDWNSNTKKWISFLYLKIVLLTLSMQLQFLNAQAVYLFLWN